MEEQALLTSRDVLTKAFEAKARRGYEPREVDAFLRQVADSLDALQDQIETLRLQIATAPTAGAAVSVPAEPASVAEQESVEMILRLAQKTAEETLSEAHRRADELMAEANFKAAQVAREADRKAFEAASRTQSELRSVEGEIEARREELQVFHVALAAEQQRIRDIATALVDMSSELTWEDDDAARMESSAGPAETAGETPPTPVPTASDTSEPAMPAEGVGPPPVGTGPNGDAAHTPGVEAEMARVEE